MSVGVAFHSDPSAPFHVSYHGCEYYSIELSSVGVDGKLLKESKAQYKYMLNAYVIM